MRRSGRNLAVLDMPPRLAPDAPALLNEPALAALFGDGPRNLHRRHGGRACVPPTRARPAAPSAEIRARNHLAWRVGADDGDRSPCGDNVARIYLRRTAPRRLVSPRADVDDARRHLEGCGRTPRPQDIASGRPDRPGATTAYAGRFSATAARRSRIASVLSPRSSRRGSAESDSRPKTRSKSGVTR